jgi:TIR domain-containing protein
MSEDQAPETRAPKAFISYSWDSEYHKDWVTQLATRLRADCIDISLDEWHLRPGDQLPKFMESAIRDSDFVLLVCTPRYREKSNERLGGVGYEGNIITGELYTRRNERKFIPLLRLSEWEFAAPSWLLGKYYIDFRDEPYSTKSYEELLSAMLGVLPTAPALGGPGTDSATRLSPEAVTRQRVYAEFAVAAVGTLQACNKRFVLYKNTGYAVTILRDEIEAEVKQQSGRFHALMHEIYLFSSESVKKAAGDVLFRVLTGQVSSMAPNLEKEFKEAHSKLGAEALPKFRDAIRKEAEIR